MTHFDNRERVSNQAGFQHIEGNLNIYATPNADSGSKDNSHYDCLRDLRVTPPGVDRARILAEKDDLLEGSCSWVLDDPAFREWWSDDKTRILWIHGDPGKGKTMMAMALIEEITKLIESGPHPAGTLAYFFCQNTVDRLSSAAAVVRSLIYLLVEQQRSLTQYVQTQLKFTGSCLFEGDDALYDLWTLLLNLLKNPALPRIYLLVDALDECTRQQVELLDLITGRSMASLSKVKWLVTSRNEPVIKERLEQGDSRVHTSLGLNSRYVSRAVTRFVKFKVAELVQMKKYDYQLRSFVDAYLQEKANGTFLWVVLACRELQKVSSWEAKSVLEKFPTGLQPLYVRMMEQISCLANTEDVKLCSSILRAVTVAVRPLHLSELVFVAGLPSQMHDDLPSVLDLISFLTLREEVVSFVHPSAKDFLSIGRGASIFPSGQSHDHSAIARRCRELLSRTLRKDICDLKAPGIVIGEVAQGLVARCLPAPIQYACCYWVRHLIQSWGCDAGSVSLRDGEKVRWFFCQSFLHWVEALSLIDKIAEGVGMVIELESVIQPEHDTWLAAFLHDARRFLLSHQLMLEMAPLQIYSAALLFSPKESVIGQIFADEVPDWIRILGASEERWGACLQTLEGHSDSVMTIVFSPDGHLVASGSRDHTVRLWDARTGTALGTLEGHSGSVNTVVFSPDERLVASGSIDSTVRLWDARTGAAHHTLKGHSDSINTVVFSPDGRVVASGSCDCTVRLWDTGTGAAHHTLEGHSDSVNTVVFSPDGALVASGSYDCTVRLWDARTGAAHHTLEGHSDSVNRWVFSPDGRMVASGSVDDTVWLWDARTGTAHHTLEGHSDSVNTGVFSPYGRMVASGSVDDTVQLWDMKKEGTIPNTKYLWGDKLSFSPDCSHLIVGAKQVDIGSSTSSMFPRTRGQTLRLHVTEEWISSATGRILWLPSDRRPNVYEIRDTIIVLGSHSGKMTFLSFNAGCETPNVDFELSTTVVTAQIKSITELPQVLDILRDPEGHKRELEERELLIYEMMRMTGVFDKDYLRPGETHTADWGPFHPEVGPQRFLVIISALLDVFDAICLATRELKDPDDSDQSFSILVQDSSRPLVCSVVPISLSSIQTIRDCVQEIFTLSRSLNEEKSIEKDFHMLETASNSMNEMCLTTLEYLGINLETEKLHDEISWAGWIHIAKLLSQILAIGVLSYVSSHTGSLSETLFKDEHQDSFLLGRFDITLLKFAKRKLACLSHFIGGPVFVFSLLDSRDEKKDVDGARDTSYAVSTLLADFDDLWGPIQITYTSEDQKAASEVTTLGGRLRRHGEPARAKWIVHEDETLCHWSSWSQPSAQASAFNPTTLLLIGAGMPLFRPNCGCTASQQGYTSILNKRLLDTSNEKSERSGSTVGINVGQYIGLSAARHNRFVPGSNAKNVFILWHVTRNPEIPDWEPPADAVEQIVGLEISKCTGNARRVTLWEILHIPEMLTFIEGRPYARAMGRHWTSHKNITSFLRTSPQVHRVLMLNIISDVVEKLKNTGVNEKGELVAWNITEPVDAYVWRPRWARMLVDNGICATFAILSNTCLTYENGRRCQAGKVNFGLPIDGRSAMMTKIQIEAAVFVDDKPCLAGPINPANPEVHGAHVLHRPCNLAPGARQDDQMPTKITLTPACTCPRHRSGQVRKFGSASMMSERARNVVQYPPSTAVGRRVMESRKKRTGHLEDKLKIIGRAFDRVKDSLLESPNEAEHRRFRSDGGQPALLVSLRAHGKSDAQLREEAMDRARASRGGSLMNPISNELLSLGDLLQDEIINSPIWTLEQEHGNLEICDLRTREIRFDVTVTCEHEPIQMRWEPSSHKYGVNRLLQPVDAMYRHLDDKLKDSKWGLFLRRMTAQRAHIIFKFQEARKHQLSQTNQTFKWVCVMDSSHEPI